MAFTECGDFQRRIQHNITIICIVVETHLVRFEEYFVIINVFVVQMSFSKMSVLI